MPAPLETQTITGSHNQFWACPQINYFGNDERVTLYHPIPEFDHVAPRIASFNDGELAKEDIPEGPYLCVVFVRYGPGSIQDCEPVGNSYRRGRDTTSGCGD